MLGSRCGHPRLRWLRPLPPDGRAIGWLHEFPVLVIGHLQPGRYHRRPHERLALRRVCDRRRLRRGPRVRTEAVVERLEHLPVSGQRSRWPPALGHARVSPGMGELCPERRRRSGRRWRGDELGRLRRVHAVRLRDRSSGRLRRRDPRALHRLELPGVRDHAWSWRLRRGRRGYPVGAVQRDADSLRLHERTVPADRNRDGLSRCRIRRLLRPVRAPRGDRTRWYPPPARFTPVACQVAAQRPPPASLWRSCLPAAFRRR
jgi:hypothetical protein